MRVSKQPEERRAELVAAARRLFDKYGIDKTRVSDIVAEVGVAQGVFYYYFKSKDEMADVVVTEMVAEVAAKRDAILASQGGFAQRLKQYVRLYASWTDSLLADDAPSTQPLQTAENPLVEKGRTILVEGWAKLVCEANAAGDIHLARPTEHAKVLLYGLECLAAEHLPDATVVYEVLEAGFGLPKGSLITA